MRILTAHNLYQVRGGEDESRLVEENLMKQNGHDVMSFEVNNNTIDSNSSKLSLALNSIWSNSSYKEIKRLIKLQGSEILHVQNFFPLISPSIYYAASSLKVPVVQSIRNYRLMCPNALLFRDGHICTECLGKNTPINGIIHKCYRGSRSATAAVSTMLAVHNSIDTWNRKVNAFIAISRFVKEKLVTQGVHENKIFIKPNCLLTDPGYSYDKKDYILYVGRLSQEKGIATLVKAWNLLKSTTTKLVVIGEGSMPSSKSHTIEFLGKLSLSETYRYMSEAKALIVPSEWHEPFGRVVVEAFANGTPVIGSQMGGIPELISSGRNGLLFEAGNAEQLANKIEILISKDSSEMAEEARREFLLKYTPEQNYVQLKQIYESVI
ncbi:glycosyltransferase [Dyadobacter sp. CY343]|uniref:glycosyltransferase n=1 Tax=Dyadobacter sp. CY343 TaxID=2907299 RepID=UPI001F39F5BD|nr:glycosyltransferase [Dyadobacter sp. CY343]MCE7059703.1 glycosyltransferase [Dyadobacter sp. CY343]